MTGSSPGLPREVWYGEDINLSPYYDGSYDWQKGDKIGMIYFKRTDEKVPQWKNLYVTTAGSSVNAKDIIDPSNPDGDYNVELYLYRASSPKRVVLHVDRGEVLAINLKYDGSLNAS